MSKNISDQLVEILVEAGIQRIYAVTGDSLNHVNAAVHRNGKIKWIHVRHEETAAFAAGAEAQLNGLACCNAGFIQSWFYGKCNASGHWRGTSVSRQTSNCFLWRWRLVNDDGRHDDHCSI